MSWLALNADVIATLLPSLFVFQLKHSSELWGVTETQMQHEFTVVTSRTTNVLLKCFNSCLTSLIWRSETKTFAEDPSKPNNTFEHGLKTCRNVENKGYYEMKGCKTTSLLWLGLLRLVVWLLLLLLLLLLHTCRFLIGALHDVDTRYVRWRRWRHRFGRIALDVGSGRCAWVRRRVVGRIFQADLWQTRMNCRTWIKTT